MSNRMGFSLPVLLAIACALCFLPGAYAFGAGNIPSFSFLEGKAFRHGDIEDTLAELIKKSGGILGRGSKFGGLDIKRVYFGNWLRDYSQAMDIAGLSKLSKQTIINLCMALGFLAHGYATGEFEVTDERLGVYLCTEHIDNPKGYASDQPGGDARKYDPRLRPPVDPRELEIDPATGMKNYIANENGTWDTSARLVRERIHQCIDAGRRARNGGSENDLYEAYRLLGTLLHTVEDFSAHSNWCELSLRRLGYGNVFCHVGDACIVQSPAGPCPPLVTGTFGGSDFIHSLLGEASDHISEASVSDLAKAMDGARSTDRGATDSIRDMLFQLPGETGGNLSREMQDVEGIRSRAASGNANEMSPQELHAALWQVLTFRDNVVKGIEVGISKIPGLSSLVEKLTDSINRFVFTTLEPLLKPIMSQATGALQEGSSAVISNNDQYEVFNNPHSSDPTHSFLSKDHFVLILNEPAGKIATIVVSHTVKAIVKAWEDTSINANNVAHEVLECFHHPNFYNDNSSVQREMGAYLKSWIEGQSAEDKRYILNALTKDSVRNGKNKRKGHEKDQIGHGCGGQYNSILSPEKVSSFAQQHVPGASSVFNAAHQAQNAFGSAQHYIGREGPQGPQSTSSFLQSDNDNYSQQTSYRGDNNSGGGGFPGASHHQQPQHHQQQQHHQQPQQHDQGPGGFGGSQGYDQGPPGGFGGPGGFNQESVGYNQQGGQFGGPPHHQGGHGGGFEGGFSQPPGPPPHGGFQGGFQQPPGPPPQWGGQQQGYNPGYGGGQQGGGNGGYY